MIGPSILRCGTVLIALLAAWCDPVPGATDSGRTLRLEVAKLSAPGLVASSLVLVLDDDDLHLDIGRAEADAIGFDGAIDWRCRLTRTDEGRRGCEGPLGGAVGAGVELAASLDAQAIAITLRQADASLRFDLPLAAGAPITLNLERAPLTALATPLRRYLPQARLRGGLLDAHVVSASGEVVDFEFKGDGLSADIGNGVALDAVNLAGTLRWDSSTDLPRLRLDATAHDGAVETPLTRIALPATPASLVVDAQALAGGRWSIRQLDWRDAGVLDLHATAELDPSATEPLSSLRARIADLQLEPLRERYLRRPIEAAGLADIVTQGSLQGELDLDSGRVARADLRSNGLRIDDPARGLRIDGLAGRFAWAPLGETDAAELRWNAAQFGTLRSGALAATLRSRDGAIELAQPFTHPLAGGEVDIRSLRVDPFADAASDLVRADLGLRGIGYDSSDGRIAAAGLNADVQLAVADPLGLPRIAAVVQGHGGELLYDAFYVKLPSTPVDLALQAQATAPQRWTIAQLDYSDPGVVDFRASAELDLAASKWLPALRLRLSQIALAAAADRYGRSWLAASGYGQLALSGKLAGEIDFDDSGLRRFALYADRIGIDDGAGRFEVRSLSGGVDWAYGSDRPATSIAWDGLRFYRIPFGPAVMPLASRDGAIELTDAVSTAVLGGKLKLEKLSLQPRSPRGERYRAALSIAGIEMGQLSEALDWPRFPGNLSGGIPDITLAGDRIELGGGLVLYVFDGKIDISGVTLERPFGVAPSLGAGIYLRGLDLKPLTSAFEMAGISGRLDGDIRNLRMVDWSPVSFDAWLRTRGGGRMSYKVVQDVTSIGGGLGSITTSLQNLAMKVVDTFGYRRLGIRCKLVDTVCTMGGIDADGTGDSYTIVEGSGLPRISIVGHRRRVDWPTFVDRVTEAITGNGPVVE